MIWFRTKNLTQWTISQSRSSIALLQLQVDGDRAFIQVKSQPNTVKVSVDAVIFEDREEIDFDLIASDFKSVLIALSVTLESDVIFSLISLLWFKQS